MIASGFGFGFFPKYSISNPDVVAKPLVNPEDLFEAKIVEATPQAQGLGIKIGMTGREAVEMLLAAGSKKENK